MVEVAGRSRVNRPYFFREADGARMEIPAFGTGQGGLVGNQLREFQMYVSARQIEAELPVPAAFGAGGWSIDGNDLTITALPDDNGSELTGIAVRVDGGDVTIINPETGETDLGLDPGEYDIDIAAISAAGQGPWSDVKSTEIAA